MTTRETTAPFPFGRNWQSFLTNISNAAIDCARADIETWIGGARVAGRSVVDIGCGSGIHSLCFHSLGASRVVSFDVDRHSVEATRSVRVKAGRAANWDVHEASILDESFVAELGTFDIVYSWGVLHHTGSMWKAIELASDLVKPGGLYWIALYVRGPRYPEDLALKRRYNAAPWLVKKMMVGRRIAHRMIRLARQRQNPLKWNARKERGMDTYHDIVDWVGGFPYEVASREETVEFLERRGFLLEKIEEHPERCNHIYLFSKK